MYVLVHYSCLYVCRFLRDMCLNGRGVLQIWTDFRFSFNVTCRGDELRRYSCYICGESESLCMSVFGLDLDCVVVSRTWRTISAVIKATKCLPGCECCWHSGLYMLLLNHSCMEATYGVWSFGPSCSVDWYTDGLTSLTVLYSSTS